MPDADPAGTVPTVVEQEWLEPFLEYLAGERRYSPYTVRNYRQAFEDFYRWLMRAELAGRGLDQLGRAFHRSQQPGVIIDPLHSQRHDFPGQAIRRPFLGGVAAVETVVADGFLHVRTSLC